MEVTQEGLAVPGRVQQGTVRLGSTFTEVVGEDRCRRTFCLTVKKIFFYEHLWDELPRGMTGKLILAGSGMEQLEKSLCPAIITGPI